MYGYGEDALTLYAVTKGLRAFLDQLEDKTPTDEVTVFFRPSFGRRSPNLRGTTPVFGEFDAILATNHAIYLVEAKWNSSAELQESKLIVSPRQIRRHQVFRWYHDRWQDSHPPTWDDFRAINRESFEAAFPGLTIPMQDTTLARNLQFVLTTVCQRNVPIVDVLLFCTVHKNIRPTTVKPNTFRLITIYAHSVGGEGFIDL